MENLLIVSNRPLGALELFNLGVKARQGNANVVVLNTGNNERNAFLTDVALVKTFRRFPAV